VRNPKERQALTNGRNIYSFESYREYLRSVSVDDSRYSLSKIASAIKIHLSKLSKVLAGDQHLTPDQAYKIAKHLLCDTNETEYLLDLVQFERSADPEYRSHLSKKLNAARHAHLRPAEMTQPDRPLLQSEEVLFYSSTLFAEVWLLSMIEGENSFSQIMVRLKMSRPTLIQVTDFLVRIGLCSVQGEKLVPIARDLRLGASRARASHALINWRFLALEHIPSRGSDEMFYSEPMAISNSAYIKILNMLRTSIDDAKQKLSRERSQTIACLNVDFFQVNRSKI